jgi:hypothetical protein
MRHRKVRNSCAWSLPDSLGKIIVGRTFFFFKKQRMTRLYRYTVSLIKFFLDFPDELAGTRLVPYLMILAVDFDTKPHGPAKFGQC